MFGVVDMHLNLTSLLLLALVLISCATPVPPTGGDPDRTGPEIISTFPQTGTVSFKERVVRFEFDEYVDRTSFRNALLMEPDLNIPLDISWRRRTATVTLLRPLPDSTTVMFTLSNQLRDTRSNRMANPFTLALSTGPEIDRGEIKVVVRPLYPTIETEGVSAFLYREPADLTQPARYTATADTSGTITFRYLSTGTYKAILVNDLNRNRVWDPAREYAQPFAEPSYTLDDAEPVDAGTIWYARQDTSRASLMVPGLLSTNRLRFRFSKELAWSPELQINLTSSDSAQTFKAGYLFNDPNDRQIAFFHTDIPTSDDLSYFVEFDSLRDRNGNLVLPYSDLIEGSSAADTTQIRYLGNFNPGGLRTQQQLVLQYSGVLQGSVVIDSLRLYMNRELANANFEVRNSYNLLLVKPLNGWRESEIYEIRTWNPATGRYVNVQPSIIKASDQGGMELVISDSAYASEPMFAQVFNSRRELVFSSHFSRELEISDLVTGTYHLVVYPDAQLRRRWFAGQITPYSSPDPIFVNRAVQVRSRMTSTVLVSFE